MAEHHVRDAAVHASVGDGVERPPVTVKPLDIGEVGVETSRPREHLAGHVEGDDARHAIGQRTGKPTDAAPDVYDYVVWRQLPAELGAQALNGPLPGLPERRVVARPVRAPVVHEPEGVLARASVPEVLHVVGAQVAGVYPRLPWFR